MLESGTELITLDHNVIYAPTFISTDKRRGAGERTSVGYWQIGDTVQNGFARGPVFKVEFVDIASIGAGVTHVKIWGIDNLDDDAPIYPIAYFKNTNISNTVNVYLRKFMFCNSTGVIRNPSGAYTVVGYKKRVIPIAW